MATSPDHPELQFVQAKYYTRGRADGPPLWIVIHDMEAGETRTRAESTAAYFATMNDGRQVSSHYTADNDSVVQCVRLGDVAWCAGSHTGNFRGIQWELSGFAAQTREQWLDEFGKAMFDRVAPIIRADAAKFRIPLQRRTVPELKALKPGITSHNDLRLAFGGTTHTDPGLNFPWDYLLDLLNREADVMAESAETRIHAFNADSYLYRLHTMNREVPYVGVDDKLWTGATFDSLFLDAFEKLIADVAEVKAKLDQLLQDGVQVPAEVNVSTASVAEIATATVDQHKARL